ncbi:MAG: mechanosensitive ion channel family protein [Cyclobacteriaceae bacterium]|nr:mechanosensitive ion channel family protein [Cyclobacteriaceae bacterium]MDW8330010.1 mechanosensitive ion channel family protein [Cyclobacteriaceae bacterium]
MNDFLKEVYWGNTVKEYLIALGIILGGMVLLRLFRKTLLNHLKKWSAKTDNKFDDYLVMGLERFGLPILNFVIIYWGIHYLHLSEKISRLVTTVTTVVITYFVVRIILTVIRKLLESYVLKQENGEAKLKQITGIMIVINVAVWVTAFVFLFDNLGYNVTAIITGLGIGGIAIALAAQNILGDLFNYFVIFFDRPFEVGDFIVVDDKRGTVDYIGIKTTRIKSISGEQIIISNSNLTGARLHNFKRMEQRRAIFTISVVYGTPLEKLKKIPQIITDIIVKEPLTNPDRVHFAAYGPYSLNFEVVFFVQSPEYNQYMDIVQDVNYKIYEAFEKEGIEFAFPTQTLFVHQKDSQAYRQATPAT